MKLRFVVGSTNKVKVGAVEEMLLEYPHLAHAEVTGVSAASGVGEQPKSLDEVVEGATNRARAAFVDADYSVGIEAGLMQVPLTKSGYMNVCVVAIYDGKEFHLGLSPAWEFPGGEIFQSMIAEGIDLSQAVRKAGFTKKPKIGTEEGIISILTKGKIDRKEYIKQALRMALIHLEDLA